MIRKLLLLLPAAGLLVLTGCPVTDASTGELSNGRFAYLCVDSSDPTCDGIVGKAVIPDLLAVGGAFDLEYAGDSGAGLVQVQPASDVMISSTAGTFAFRIPGIAAMLAKNNGGVVADFVHLRGVDVDHLDVLGESLAESIKTLEMTTGVAAALAVSPRDRLDARLGGALAYTWASSDPSIVAVNMASARNSVILAGIAAGTATVEVSLPSGLKMAVLVTVKQGVPMTTSSSSGAGGSSSSGSGTTTTGAGGAGGGK